MSWRTAFDVNINQAVEAIVTIVLAANRNLGVRHKNGMGDTSDGAESREPQLSSRIATPVTGGTNVLLWIDSDGSDSSASESVFSGREAVTAMGAHDATPPRASYSMAVVFEPFSAAYRAMNDQSDDVHTYETRYMTEQLLARVYRCRSHSDCEHRYKIKTINGLEVPTQFHLERSGAHGSQRTTASLLHRPTRGELGIYFIDQLGVNSTPESRRGVHPELVDEVDALLHMGWGAMQLRTMLNHRYRDQPRLLCMVPTSKQLENRKAFLVRSSANGRDISNHVTFTAWASNRMGTSRSQFLVVEDAADRGMDEMLVLDAFSFDGQEEGEGTSFGVVDTTRRVFRNVLSSVRDQPGSLLCATDGTYKLHFGGWTVVDCGSVGLSWPRGKYVHSFIPWVYMFVRTESKAAYARMFEVVCDRAWTFLRVEVRVSFGSIVHSDAIASAFFEVWPEAVIFSVSKHIVGGQGILGADVDDARATKFLHSLNGRFPRGIKHAELEFELLSLHKVLVKQPNYSPSFELLPIWPAESIERLRNFLHCTCEGFIRSGWVCSLVLAVLSLLGLIDLGVVMASVPVGRTPGRPPSRTSALTRENTEEGFYDVDRLVRLFLRRPGQPLLWRVVGELNVARAQTDETSSVIGEVIGLRLSDGVYKWSVRFGDGSVTDYEAEQPARAVNRAHNLRVRVTN